MIEKYQSAKDNELIFDYKKTHDEDLENEIISRYKKNSKILASLLFTKFKFLYQVEFDDIYCIVLGSLFAAIRGFSDATMDFYQYWRKTATNEVMNYVRGFTCEGNVNEYKSNPYNEEPALVGYLKQNSATLVDDYYSTIELDEVFANPRNKFRKHDGDLFNLYLAGYSISDIAELSKLSYKQVRYRISIIKRKLANILFNQ